MGDAPLDVFLGDLHRRASGPVELQLPRTGHLGYDTQHCRSVRDGRSRGSATSTKFWASRAADVHCVTHFVWGRQVREFHKCSLSRRGKIVVVVLVSTPLFGRHRAGEERSLALGHRVDLGDVVEKRSERTKGFKKHLTLVGEHGALSCFRLLGNAMRNVWLNGAVCRPLGVEMLAL